MTPNPKLDVSDDLREMLAGLMSLPAPSAQYAECAESTADAHSANCAHSAPASVFEDAAETIEAAHTFARSDADLAQGQPVYGPSDAALALPVTLYEAGANSLILAYALRRHTERWLAMADGEPPDAAILHDVLEDLHATLRMLEPAKPEAYVAGDSRTRR